MDFAEYVCARRPTLFRTAVLLGCPRQDADDLVQVTLTRCYRHWAKVSRAANPDAYVYRVLVNAFRDARTRRWRGELPTEHLPETAVTGEDVAAALAVRQAVASLSEEHRAVLVLRFYADLSERETARVLGLPAGTVKSRTARALAVLAADETITRSTSC